MEKKILLITNKQQVMKTFKYSEIFFFLFANYQQANYSFRITNWPQESLFEFKRKAMYQKFLNTEDFHIAEILNGVKNTEIIDDVEN